jgi:pSer/pThr/pTyr-binding forkhead associated (FHA) protein
MNDKPNRQDYDSMEFRDDDENLPTTKPDNTTADVRRDADEALSLYQQERSALMEKRKGEVIEGSLSLRLEVNGSATPLVIAVMEETVIGRRDPTASAVPEVDLTPYGGYQMGISRRHAALRLQNKQLDVLDLGSRNGTYLNGERLKPHQPVALLDGDELRLGKIVIRVFYQRQ